MVVALLTDAFFLTHSPLTLALFLRYNKLKKEARHMREPTDKEKLILIKIMDFGTTQYSPADPISGTYQLLVGLAIHHLKVGSKCFISRTVAN